jgi:hypothetical protein
MSSPAPEESAEADEELYPSTLAHFLSHPSYPEALIAFGLFVEAEREYEKKKGRLTAQKRAAYHDQAIHQKDLLIDKAQRTLLKIHNEWVARDLRGVTDAIKAEATNAIEDIKQKAVASHKRWRWAGMWEAVLGGLVFLVIGYWVIVVTKIWRPDWVHMALKLLETP